ncbi:hypothetical protein N2152v2_009363 [Parachlorella kessleri]
MGSTVSRSSSSGSQGWQPSPARGTQERRLSKAGYDITPMTAEDREREAAKLTDFQRSVALESGTERAFTGRTVDGSPHDNKRKGVYVSAIGGLPLFSSDTKFDSGTGWPSFYAPIDPEHVIEVKDSSIPFMPRVEVLDARRQVLLQAVLATSVDAAWQQQVLHCFKEWYGMAACVTAAQQA